MSWFDDAKLVNFGPDDKPGKYGFTEKMNLIWDLVEAGKPLEDGGFEITEADREFYDDYKFEFEEKKKSNGGVPYRFPRYIYD